MKRLRNRARLHTEALEARLLLTGFTAYNGLFSGDTHENTTFYSDMGSADRSGPLVDVESGAATSVLVTTEENGRGRGWRGRFQARGLGLIWYENPML